MSRKFCHEPEDVRTPGCGFCDRWHDDPAYRERCIVAHAVTRTPGTPLTGEQYGAIVLAVTGLRAPCKWQGDVVEKCTADGCGQREANHIRICLYDSAEWDVCQRGPLKTKSGIAPDGILTRDNSQELRSCLHCPKHVSA